MPMYYFECHRDGDVFHDDIGSDLPDDLSAQNEAMATMLDAMRCTGTAQRHTIRMHVRDVTGRVLYQASLTFCGSSAD